MTHLSEAHEPRNPYELSWVSSPNCLLALDCNTGKLFDANPAAVALSGYSHDELVGMSLLDLHPEAEREQISSEFLSFSRKPSRPFSGFHLQRKDNQQIPVAIWPSPPVVLDGQTVVCFTYRNIIERVKREHQLSAMNWSLSAFSSAALALGRAQSAEGLLQSICEALTKESVYALAWIGIAEDDPEKNVRIAAAAGRGIGYMDGLQVRWSENDPMGRGPTGNGLRSGKVEPAPLKWGQNQRLRSIGSLFPLARTRPESRHPIHCNDSIFRRRRKARRADGLLRATQRI
jgi:PAS domain S-box-containing protein